jgi:hypothetical protein
MNTFGKRIRFWRKPRADSSRFATVLPRIRAIREQCDWQPLTNAWAAHHRSDRVRNARRAVAYHALPCERDLQFRLPAKLKVWRCLIGVVGGFFLVALVWISVVADWDGGHKNYVYGYQLPASPPFLSEDLALAWARQSLAKVVADAPNWKPVAQLGTATRLAADGVHEKYLLRHNRTNLNAGLLLFENARLTNETWLVTLVLNSNQLECTVSRQR